MNNLEVVIVSAYGRGDLLATELQTRGFQVGLLDYSVALGERTLPELEGPFPIVRPNPLLPAHLEWLMTHSFEEIPNGFAIWLKSGPVELRGPLASHYQKKFRAIGNFKELNEDVKHAEVTKKTAVLNFEDSWAIQFAHSFASNEFRRSTDCHLAPEYFPLQQPMHRSIFSQESLTKVHKDMKATGAQFINCEALYDIQLEKNGISEIEYKAGEKAVINAKYWIWCLSSEETASLSRKVSQKLFPKPAVADWAWRRFQMHSAKSVLSEIVPSYLVMVDDLHFPWTYDNLIVLKRRTDELSDLWVRLPSESSQKPEQLKKFMIKLEERLKTRFAHNPFEMEVPWSAGPPMYPVFEPETLKQFEKVNLRNFMFEGPEAMPRLDWCGRFQVQAQTMLRVQTLKLQDMAKQKKENKSDQALHAP